jgi:hypothetical protein
MILNIFTSIIFPLSIPFINYLLSKPDLGSDMIIDDNSNRTIKYSRNIFLSELPTALMANCIWGATYTTTGLSEDAIKTWIAIYFALAIFQIILMIMNKKDINNKIYYSLVTIIGISIVILTFIRMCNPSIVV